ncbi:MAG: tetratricopeptide repeat protein [Phycisphaerae bacterium]
MRCAGRILPAVLLTAFASLVGCAKDTPIVLQYDRPALEEKQIPAHIRKIAIADFTSPPREQEYGRLVAETLSSQLDKCNQKFNRFALVDRRNLKRILEERGMQMAMSDSGQAVNAGKILNADAIIFGNVAISSEDIRGTKMVPSYSGRSITMKPVPTVKRVVTATVTFTMDDVNNGRMIITRTIKPEPYDSEKEDKSALKALGMSSAERKAVGDAAGVLIDRAVREFVALITPHVVDVNVVLSKGKSAKVANGNALAEAKEYADALNVYQAAFAEKPDDYGAAFNAGVMYEAMGKMKEAEEWYTKAIQGEGTNKEYIRSRARVRAEMDSGLEPSSGKTDNPPKGG